MEGPCALSRGSPLFAAPCVKVNVDVNYGDARRKPSSHADWRRCRPDRDHARAIRYYEQIGLLPGSAGRRKGGHRHYGEDDVERLVLITRMRDLLGLSLDDLDELVAKARRLAGTRPGCGRTRRRWSTGSRSSTGRRHGSISSSPSCHARRDALTALEQDLVTLRRAEVLSGSDVGPAAAAGLPASASRPAFSVAARECRITLHEVSVEGFRRRAPWDSKNTPEMGDGRFIDADVNIQSIGLNKAIRSMSAARRAGLGWASRMGRG